MRHKWCFRNFAVCDHTLFILMCHTLFFYPIILAMQIATQRSNAFKAALQDYKTIYSNSFLVMFASFMPQGQDLWLEILVEISINPNSEAFICKGATSSSWFLLDVRYMQEQQLSEGPLFADPVCTLPFQVFVHWDKVGYFCTRNSKAELEAVPKDFPWIASVEDGNQKQNSFS